MRTLVLLALLSGCGTEIARVPTSATACRVVDGVSYYCVLPQPGEQWRILPCSSECPEILACVTAPGGESICRKEIAATGTVAMPPASVAVDGGPSDAGTLVAPPCIPGQDPAC